MELGHGPSADARRLTGVHGLAIREGRLYMVSGQAADGSILMGDDSNGAIYRISYGG